MMVIVFISIVPASAVDEAISGIHNELSKFDHKYTIKLYSGPPGNEAVQTYIKACIQEGASLFITTGAHVTHLALEEVQKMQNPLPVFFWGVTDPIGQRVVLSLDETKNNISGVSTEPLAILLPHQLLLRVLPKTKNILLLLRANAQFGQGATNALSTKKYFYKKT